MRERIESELSALEHRMAAARKSARRHLEQSETEHWLAVAHLDEHDALRLRRQDLVLLLRTGVFHA